MSQDHTVSEADSLRVSVLSEALPFIQRFSGRCMVVKYGGAAMVREDLREAIFRDLVLLSCVGVKVVVVHGGGPEINAWLGRLQIQPEFREGLRVTDSETMDVVEMVLVGRLNKRIVNGLNLVGGGLLAWRAAMALWSRPAPWGTAPMGWWGTWPMSIQACCCRCWKTATCR